MDYSNYKVDPHTGEHFVPRRSNQVFATPANKIKFNNLKAKKRRDKFNKHDNILHKNEKILSQLMDCFEKTFTQEFLLGSGFDFAHYESKDFLEDDWELYYLYDFIYWFEDFDVNVVYMGWEDTP